MVTVHNTKASKARIEQIQEGGVFRFNLYITWNS